MVPVLFKGGPLHRQVHVWATVDAERADKVRLERDGTTGWYVRSRRWRSLLNTHRALIYAWRPDAMPTAWPERTEGGAGSNPDL